MLPRSEELEPTAKDDKPQDQYDQSSIDATADGPNQEDKDEGQSGLPVDDTHLGRRSRSAICDFSNVLEFISKCLYPLNSLTEF